MRAIVCGGRNVGRTGNNPSDVGGGIARATAERRLVSDKMLELHAQHQFTLIIGGNEGGAERLGTHWAEINRIPVKIVERRHRESTILRNLRMLRENATDVIIAFGGGESTDALIAEAKKAGIPVIRMDLAEATVALPSVNVQLQADAHLTA